MGFKFLNTEEVPYEPIGVQENYINTLPHESGVPTVFTRINRNRNDLSDREFEVFLTSERHKLFYRLWNNQHISHTVIYEDDNSFTVRTEINL